MQSHWCQEMNLHYMMASSKNQTNESTSVRKLEKKREDVSLWKLTNAASETSNWNQIVTTVQAQRQVGGPTKVLTLMRVQVIARLTIVDIV